MNTATGDQLTLAGRIDKVIELLEGTKKVMYSDHDAGQAFLKYSIETLCITCRLLSDDFTERCVKGGYDLENVKMKTDFSQSFRLQFLKEEVRRLEAELNGAKPKFKLNINKVKECFNGGFNCS